MTIMTFHPIYLECSRKQIFVFFHRRRPTFTLI